MFTGVPGVLTHSHIAFPNNTGPPDHGQDIAEHTHNPDPLPLHPHIAVYNIISGTAGGRKFQKRKHIEPIEMERLWFDVTHLFEELLLAFD